MERCISITLLVTSAIIDSSANPLTRIVNGTNAKEEEIPYIVSLRRNFRHKCGGSIVNSKCILTAAHCVYHRDPSEYSIQFGELRLNNQSVNSIDVEEFTWHEDYIPGGGYHNDVAVSKLVSPIEFGKTVQPIKLPEQGQAFEEWSNAVLAGWGWPYSNGSAMIDLQRVDIFLYPDSECESAYTTVSRKYHVCAGIPEGGKGQCNGDSGGPLTVEGVQVGIVSWSVKPCTIKGYPGVFTRVSRYVDWILEKCSD